MALAYDIHSSPWKKVNEALGAGKMLILVGVPIYLIMIFINSFFFPTWKFPIVSTLFNFILGLVILITGFILFARVIPWIIRINKTGELYTNGPFRYVRHPLYSVILCIIIPGITILLELILTLIFLPTMLILFHFIIKNEEKLLLEKFGDEYKDYMKKTKRIIPWIY